MWHPGDNRKNLSTVIEKKDEMDMNNSTEDDQNKGKINPNNNMQYNSFREKMDNLRGVRGQRDEYIATGLINMGNTCYLSAVIQSLANCNNMYTRCYWERKITYITHVKHSRMN